MIVDGLLSKNSEYNSGDYVEFTGHLAPHSPLAVDDRRAADLLDHSYTLIQNFGAR